jgi:hypothetical protein
LSGWEEVRIDVPRDRWDRPMIKPREGVGNHVPYTRATTLAGSIEDTYQLGKWQIRMAAMGLLDRRDLAALIASYGKPPKRTVNPDTWIAYKQWKSKMDKACDQAIEFSKAHEKANLGTAMHGFVERLDQGESIDQFPPEFRPAIEAYTKATAKLTSVHVEQFMVHDGIQAAGTPDRIVSIQGLPGLYIADLKTGVVADYTTGKMSMQLGIYSRSIGYNIKKEERFAIGPINQDRGIIIELDAETGICKLHWIDIDVGFRMVQVALSVRQWRKSGDTLLTPFDQGEEIKFTPPPNDQGQEPLPMDIEPAVDQALQQAINEAPDRDSVTELWKIAGERWNDRHTSLAKKRLLELGS